jgi:hypothetical protein
MAAIASTKAYDVTSRAYGERTSGARRMTMPAAPAATSHPDPARSPHDPPQNGQADRHTERQTPGRRARRLDVELERGPAGPGGAFHGHGQAPGPGAWISTSRW